MVHWLANNPIHLGLRATAVPQPDYTGDMQWYEDYAKRHAQDGSEGRLVSMHTFSNSWDTWEMHPNGHEVVLCTDGELTLIQEIGGTKSGACCGRANTRSTIPVCGTRPT
jgi:hypothetical protein